MASLTGSFDAEGEVSEVVHLPPKEKVTFSVANSFSGTAVLEKQDKSGGFSRILSMTAPQSSEYINMSQESENLRLRCDSYTSVQTVSFVGTPASGTLTLEYGDGGDEAAVDHDESAADLQAAIRLITGLEAATVTGTFAEGFTINLVGVAAGHEVFEVKTNTLEDESTDPVAAAVEEQTIDYTLADAVDVLHTFVDKYGRPFGSVDDQQKVALTGALYVAGAITKAGVNDINSFEEVETNGEDPTELDISVYQSKITTGGTEAAEEAEIGDGTGAIIGQRKLIVLESLGDAADSVILDDANFSQADDTISAIELDEEGEFVLAEWQGASWEIIKASDGVVSVSE